MNQNERAEKILLFIHENYKEKITADNIAESLKISRGECFRCFKKHMNKGITEYINEYRLSKAEELLKTTDMSVMDISAECGFENASYFGKTFKEFFKVTPLKYRKTQVWDKNTWEVINGYYYQYYKDRGNGKMIITGDETNGSFSCEWDTINNILLRSGKVFFSRDKTHSEIGNITLEYEAVLNPYGDALLSVYGWTVEPLTEWLIVERYFTYRPPSDGKLIGILESDGSTYEIFHVTRKNRPCILGGLSDFEQYWSVRKSGRLHGTVNVSNHFRAWENFGLSLGKLTEISLSVEGWLSSGNAEVKKNVITIKPMAL
ncbi:MAG: glycoside hydrolase family 11 protein [Clostridiales bacterium]|jgi:AraC-like DNA-binding protein|nr:glycoside hydrolase family 11 protein [Clostridiales bacterium]